MFQVGDKVRFLGTGIIATVTHVYATGRIDLRIDGSTTHSYALPTLYELVEKGNGSLPPATPDASDATAASLMAFEESTYHAVHDAAQLGAVVERLEFLVRSVRKAKHTHRLTVAMDAMDQIDDLCNRVRETHRYNTPEFPTKHSVTPVHRDSAWHDMRTESEKNTPPETGA